MATVSKTVTYAAAEAAAKLNGLGIMGALHEDGSTILLLGPGKEFWEIFKLSPELNDGAEDPFNRWSERIIGHMADTLGAKARFPFGGPPYEPFLRWAMDSGRAWQSPVGMLVHDEAGMMISFRGALHFSYEIDLPAPPAASPCETCETQPCVSACPVGALSDQHFYKIDACHAYLDTPAGQSCMSHGCIARRACPVSQSFDRNPAQSAIHMRYFHRS
ncbi:Epoxyqueuosine reductase [Roseovarius albus]|uniref:Epoxyqueuosine reductase n=1 Tax=Roseovarius albus TaxID=1247867 RepID=A0A1X6ZUI1_9RHOB|nr:ferredoxin [Roseovarius albus]SLN61776.1 Epoxyqueuosine reductase [Roseovarius albus]